jgi:hypothetical protein
MVKQKKIEKKRKKRKKKEKRERCGNGKCATHNNNK